MSDKKNISPPVYLVIDCEFTEQGLVRELVLLLYKGNLLVRAIEVFISQSGVEEGVYNHQQINYHIKDGTSLNPYINAFIDSCKVYAPLTEIKIVGMSLEHDLKSIINTVGTRSKLNNITQKTQLEICGRGTLEDKAKNHQVTSTKINQVLNKLVTPQHKVNYRYHTALYDAVVTGYVYLCVMGDQRLMGVHDRFKKCTHTLFDTYYSDISKNSTSKRKPVKSGKIVKKVIPIKKEEVPQISKKFPEIRYRVQKNISNVFDIVAREMFYQHIARLRYEPSLKKIDIIKKEIMELVYPVKYAVTTYDTSRLLTDPYNISLVKAGVLLVNKKISLEDFIDFSIYMQQYNLPDDKGNYYKVTNHKKEIFVRCLQEKTARKLISKRPYCTIEQFLKKEMIECSIEVLK